MLVREEGSDRFKLLYLAIANEAAPRSKNPEVLQAYKEYMQSKTKQYPNAETPELEIIMREIDISHALNYLCNTFAQSESDKEEWARLEQRYTPVYRAEHLEKERVRKAWLNNL